MPGVVACPLPPPAADLPNPQAQVGAGARLTAGGATAGVGWQEQAEAEATDNIQKVEELATSITTEAAQVEQDAAVVSEEAQKDAVEAAEGGDEGLLEKVGGASLVQHPARARLSAPGTTTTWLFPTVV